MAVITPPSLLAAKGHLKAAAVLATTMACYGLAQADGLSALDQHLKTMRSGTASFTQTVSNANKPGAVKPAAGSLPSTARSNSASTTPSLLPKPSWPTAKPCGCTMPT